MRSVLLTPWLWRARCADCLPVSLSTVSKGKHLPLVWDSRERSRKRLRRLLSRCDRKWPVRNPQREGDMHELSLMTDLMRKITAVACAHGAAKVTSVTP